MSSNRAEDGVMVSAKPLRLMIAVPLLLVSTSLVSAQTVGTQGPGTPGVGSGTGFVHALPPCPSALDLAQVVVTQAFQKTSAGAYVQGMRLNLTIFARDERQLW